MTSSLPPFADFSAKILLVKSGLRESQARAFVLTNRGLYTRELGSEEEITYALGNEKSSTVMRC